MTKPLTSQLFSYKMMKNRTLDQTPKTNTMIPKPGEFSIGFIDHVNEDDMMRVQCTLKNAASYVTHCYQQWIWNDPVENQNPEKFANELLKIAKFLEEDESAHRKIGILMKEVTFMLIFIAENVHTWHQHKCTWTGKENTQTELKEYIDSMKKACFDITNINVD